VLVPVPHQTGSIDWTKKQAEFKRVVLRQLAKVGIEDVERRCRVEHEITPRDWEQQGIYRGATFNLAHSLGQMLHLRPRNRFEDLQSVYLVGGGTHPGSGLPTIYSSARIASNSLIEDLGVVPSIPTSVPGDAIATLLPWHSRSFRFVWGEPL
jgi:phytoene desaturase